MEEEGKEEEGWSKTCFKGDSNEVTDLHPSHQNVFHMSCRLVRLVLLLIVSCTMNR